MARGPGLGPKPRAWAWAKLGPKGGAKGLGFGVVVGPGWGQGWGGQGQGLGLPGEKIIITKECQLSCAVVSILLTLMVWLGLMCTGTAELRVFDLVGMTRSARDEDYARL